MDEQDNKKELLERIQKSRAPLDALLLRMSEDQMLQPGVEGRNSVKDLLAHITTWEQHLVRRLAAALRDGAAYVYVVEPGELDDTDAVNALIFVRNAQLPLSQVLRDYRRSLDDVLQAVDALSEKDLYDPQGLARVFGRSVESIIGSDAFDHYPEHIESIRIWLEEH